MEFYRFSCLFSFSTLRVTLSCHWPLLLLIKPLYEANWHDCSAVSLLSSSILARYPAKGTWRQIDIPEISWCCLFVKEKRNKNGEHWTTWQVRIWKGLRKRELGSKRRLIKKLSLKPQPSSRFPKESCPIKRWIWHWSGRTSHSIHHAPGMGAMLDPSHGLVLLSV